MTRTNDGGPAYPVPWEYAENETGMSLRDAAALAALQGFCANPNVLSEIGYESHLATRAWAVADAFIAARETKET